MPNWKKVIVSGSDASLNKLTVTNGITGSLLGTASYASQALSSSFATTASYALTAGNGGVTKIIAGANVNLSPVNGLGDVTITSFGTNLYNTATGSYGSFYDTGSVTATSATIIYSMSLSTTDISNGVFVSASNGDITRVKFTNAGTYNIQFSSQFSNSDNSNQDVVVWIRKNGTDIPDSSGTVGVPPFKAGSNGQALASWNYYVPIAANDFIQLCWHSEQANVITLETIAAGTSPTHPRTPSTILTATRVDTFLSNTGSFSGSFTGILTGTASYASQALSASYASTASYVLQAVSASFASTSNTQIVNNNSNNVATTAYVDSKRTKSYCFSAGYNATLAISVEEVAFCIMISASFIAVNDILELYQFHSVNNSVNAKTVSTYLSPQVETVGSTISANAKKIATITGLTGAGAQSSGLAKHYAIRSNTTMINTYNPSLSLGTDTGTIAAATVVTNIPDITGSMYFVGVVNRSNSGDTVTINSSQLKLFKSE